MSIIMISLRAIVPIFVTIAAGYFSKRLGIIREAEVSRFNSIIFKVFMLIMCFYNVSTSDLSSAVRPKLMIFAVAAVAAAYLLSLGYAVLFVKDRGRRGVVIQGLYRSNFVILGLPVAAGLAAGQDVGAVALLSAVTTPIFNVLAVLTLEAYSGQKADVKKLVLGVVKNPLIIGCVSGLVFLICGLKLPDIIEPAIRDMAKAASPMMLFLLGAFFRFDGFKGHIRELAAVCIGRLIIIPALTLGAAAAMGFRGVDFVALLTLFASPTAVASFTMAQQMGGDAKLAGNIVVMTSLLCSVTLFAWSVLFQGMGVF